MFALVTLQSKATLYVLQISLYYAVFEQCQKAGTQFVQTIAELASRPQTIDRMPV